VDSGAGVAQGGGSSGVGADLVALIGMLLPETPTPSAPLAEMTLSKTLLLPWLIWMPPPLVAETGGPGHVRPDRSCRGTVLSWTSLLKLLARLTPTPALPEMTLRSAAVASDGDAGDAIAKR
jgi:hypothetical protein